MSGWAAIVFPGGCAALIVWMLMRFDKRLKAMGKSHENALATIGAATEVLSGVDASVLRSRDMTRLARAYARILELDSHVVRIFAEVETGRHNSFLESLGQGRVECPGENHDWLLALTACAYRTLYAISTPLDRDFWGSEPAQWYLAAQREVIHSRGVDVRRLFLVRDESEVTESLERLCHSHSELGIEVRIVVLTQLGPRPQTAVLSDFVLFDGELSYEILPDIRGVPARTTLRTAPDHVQERISRFRDLWEAASPPDRDGVSP
ncbi:DUF6879 family protein [Streptomyces sp. NPDC002611]